jgi:hypothetical protein
MLYKHTGARANGEHGQVALVGVIPSRNAEFREVPLVVHGEKETISIKSLDGGRCVEHVLMLITPVMKDVPLRTGSYFAEPPGA